MSVCRRPKLCPECERYDRGYCVRGQSRHRIDFGKPPKDRCEQFVIVPWKRNIYRCQFCEKNSPKGAWKDDRCPICGKKYDAMLAQDLEDSP